LYPKKLDEEVFDGTEKSQDEENGYLVLYDADLAATLSILAPIDIAVK
jgi:hypothetical protein